MSVCAWRRSHGWVTQGSPWVQQAQGPPWVPCTLGCSSSPSLAGHLPRGRAVCCVQVTVQEMAQEELWAGWYLDASVPKARVSEGLPVGITLLWGRLSILLCTEVSQVQSKVSSQVLVGKRP